MASRRRHGRVLAGWLAAALAAAGLAGAPGDPETGLERAAALLAGGQPAAAAELYARHLDSHPLAVEAHEGLAASLAAQERAREAAARLDEGARRLLAATRYPEAARLAARAVELAPDSAGSHQLLGRARALARSYREAEPALRRAVELGRRDPQTLLYLASTLWENGGLAEAEQLLRGLLERGSAAGPAAAQLGRLLLWQGRAAEAVPVLERALAARPQSTDLLFALARAREGAGELEAALAVYRQVTELAPEVARHRFALGRLLLRLGDRAGGESELEAYRRLYEEEQRLTRERGLERVRIDAALELARQGRWREAAEALRSLPASPDALGALGRVLAAAGEPVAAAEALERALAAQPGRRDLAALLAEQKLLAAEGGGR